MVIEAFNIEESANDDHYAAFFAGYSGYPVTPGEIDALKAALVEEGHDEYPGPNSIYNRLSRGVWKRSYKHQDFHWDEECEEHLAMLDLLGVAINKLDRDEVSEEKRKLMAAYLSGWVYSGNFLESPIFAYFKAEEYVKSVFGIEK
jgi:hypothetical protein